MPALAAGDPTRRDDLERLINLFPTPPADSVVITMRPSRLKELLGLADDTDRT